MTVRAAATFGTLYWEAQAALLTFGLGAMFGFWVWFYVQRAARSAALRWMDHARSRGRTGTTFGAGRF